MGLNFLYRTGGSHTKKLIYIYIMYAETCQTGRSWSVATGTWGGLWRRSERTRRTQITEGHISEL